MQGDDAPFPHCIVCVRSCGEPGDFLALAVGAILHDDSSRQSGGPNDRLSAFFSLTKHGAEPDDAYVSLPLVCDLIGGQVELLLCSTPCLRGFLNSAVNELERWWLQA